MPLPQFFQRFRSGAQASPPQGPPLSSAEIEQARVRARRRMVGMAVLVAAGVIGFPWLFETQPRPLPGDVRVVSAVTPQAAEPGGVAAAALGGAARPLPPTEAAQPEAGGGEPAEEVIEATSSVRLPQPAAPRLPAIQARPAPESLPARNDPPRPASSAPRNPDARSPAAPPPAAKPENTPKPKAAASNPLGGADADTRYIVQVGAFSDVASARTARLKVEGLGIKTYTQAIDTPSGRKIRVRVGPYVNKADAENAMSTLKKAGMSGALLTL